MIIISIAANAIKLLRWKKHVLWMVISIAKDALAILMKIKQIRIARNERQGQAQLCCLSSRSISEKSLGEIWISSDWLLLYGNAHIL
jgi:hypothetical protein